MGPPWLVWQLGTGAAYRTAQSKQEVVSVDDFGAIGNGMRNDSAAVSLAILLPLAQVGQYDSQNKNLCSERCCIVREVRYMLAHGATKVRQELEYLGILTFQARWT